MRTATVPPPDTFTGDINRYYWRTRVRIQDHVSQVSRVVSHLVGSEIFSAQAMTA